ncbi:hypothetical protein CBW65_04655 [Tumebacillus avium]|uniref:Ketoreductase domain-containing protein n=1 Tax=Tumebacillus avium TaxID=1903704 RepID=A0A1Y0IIY9_9BACL|nr:SDR family NAD(P)-dependent oxidoreductase [Tumebacillus avium]ARU60438.1 hypothetical protein CBW65_04655 [Tumebacillus avium]
MRGRGVEHESRRVALRQRNWRPGLHGARSEQQTRRVALIAGGSGAIGSAVAEQLAARGDIAVIGYVSAPEAAFAKAEELQAKYGVPAHAVALDVRDRAALDAAVRMLLEKYGRLDVLVNAAGITRDRMLSKLTGEDFDEVSAVNLKGAFSLMQAILPAMRQQSYGRIVHITSYAGIHGRIEQSAYAATKAALIGLTKAAALEELPYGITVNAVAPSVTESKMTAQLTAEATERLLQKIPLGRMQTPEEAAGLITWLTSEGAGTISGQVFAGDNRQYGW